MKRIWRDDYRYDEPETLEFEEEIEVPIDAVIYIDDNGDWEYEDEEYSWAQPDDVDDTWTVTSYEYPDVEVEVGDAVTIVEYIDDLLEPLMPFTPGKFRISGDAILAFKISDVKKYSDYIGQDEDDGPIFEEEYQTDDADVEFLFDKSSIDNFEIEEIQ